MKANHFLCCAVKLLFTCFVAGGCQGVCPQEGLLERQDDDARLSSHQLRVMVNEFVIHSADRVELTADRILAITSDPAVRKNALLWKINGLSACFQAASRPDPLAAYLDIWILNRQTMQFFESAAGSSLFGVGQAIAQEECHSLERRLQGIDQALGGNLRLGSEFVGKFAADYPITSLYFDREPVASRYIEEVKQPARELMQVVANLDGSVDELKRMSHVYAKYLPKQARWEAELFLIDSMQLAALQRPLQDFSITAAAAARIATVTESIPGVVERERHALREIVVEEREQTLRELERMREESLGTLEQERAVVLDALRQERQAVLESVHVERVGVSRDLHVETTRALRAVDAITHRRTEELVEHAPHLVDHFFWRAWQLCTAFAILVAGFTWLVLRARPQSDTTPVKFALRGRADEHLSVHNHDEGAKAA